MRLAMVHALSQSMTVTQGGRRRRMTKQDIIAQAVVNDALKGDAKARAQVLRFSAAIEREKQRLTIVVPSPSNSPQPAAWEYDPCVSSDFDDEDMWNVPPLPPAGELGVDQPSDPPSSEDEPPEQGA